VSGLVFRTIKTKDYWKGSVYCLPILLSEREVFYEVDRSSGTEFGIFSSQGLCQQQVTTKKFFTLLVSEFLPKPLFPPEKRHFDVG
jgi:hypothetical protein